MHACRQAGEPEGGREGEEVLVAEAPPSPRHGGVERERACTTQHCPARVSCTEWEVLHNSQRLQPAD